MRRELGIARCGLACCLCTENADCNGCDSNSCPDNDFCENKKCSIAKELTHCYKCEETCKKGLLSLNKSSCLKKPVFMRVSAISISLLITN